MFRTIMPPIYECKCREGSDAAVVAGEMSAQMASPQIIRVRFKGQEETFYKGVFTEHGYGKLKPGASLILYRTDFDADSENFEVVA
jgi:hypothetical protein